MLNKDKSNQNEKKQSTISVEGEKYEKYTESSNVRWIYTGI